MSNSDEFVEAIIASAKAQVADRKRPGAYYLALLEARKEIPSSRGARLLASARMVLVEQDAEITRLRKQLEDCCGQPGTNRSTPAS